MCGICGCSDHDHHHAHDDVHDHQTHLLHVEQDILAQNNHLASHNLAYLAQEKNVSLNIMSSPGSGKTTLLVKTITDLKHQLHFSVIVGDQQTDEDAQAIQATGVQAIQINTGKGCHLDAHRVGHALEELSLQENGIVFIENIGNLVCPALFDLGEHFKVVMLSVTEGDNKPLKYPDMFHAADVLLITKSDLLPYVPFDLDRCIANARKIKSNLEVIVVSALKGEGLADWYHWLQHCLPKAEKVYGSQQYSHTDHR